MKHSDIPHLRLLNQHIARAQLETPGEVVEWLGAVQAQEYAGAKWALGLRLQGGRDVDVERSFTEGSILRTHLMRPTWHFVTPADIRWMLALTAPRVHAANAYMYRKLELDQTVFTRSNGTIVKALQGGNRLTREELRVALREAGVATEGELRLGYIMMRAELDAIVCSGPRRGKQFTYMLLDERVPQSPTMGREEALATLTRRFFISHGPATVHDFAKWSGLTISDGRIGLEMASAQLSREVMGAETFWFSTHAPPEIDTSRTAYLLPIYDEYTIGYKEHSAVFDAATTLDQLVFPHTIVIGGRVAGTWRRTLKKNSVVLELNTFVPLTKAEKHAVEVAARHYGTFLDLPVVIT